MMHLQNMNLLVTLDNGYIPYLNVMLASAITANPDCYFDVYLLHSSIRERDTVSTRSVLGKNGQLVMINAEEPGLEGAPTTSRSPKEIYYRHFCGKVSAGHAGSGTVP